MHKAAFAELMLMLVMPPNRAAATAGDLVESGRRPFTFWIELARTFVGAVMHQMSVGLAAKAIPLAILLGATFRILFGAVLIAGGRIAPGLVWLGPILGVAFLLLMPVLVGRVVGRFLAGHEIAAWTAIAIFVCLASFAWWLTQGTLGLAFQIQLALLVSPTSLLPLLVGVLLARRRGLQA